MATFKFNTFPLNPETDIIHIIYDHDNNPNNNLSNIVHEAVSKHLIPLDKAVEYLLKTNKKTFITTISSQENSRLVTLKASKLNSFNKSRNLGVLRADILSKEIKGSKSLGSKIAIVAFLEGEQLVSFVSCVAQCFPTFTKKTQFESYSVNLFLFDKTGSTFELDKINQSALILENVSRTMALVDTPCMELDVDQYLNIIKQVYTNNKNNNIDIQLQVIQGEELKKQGLNGIYSVGKAAVNKPALAILSLNGNNPNMKGLALVGKGICYDTGGLSIKSGINMISMKGDMGGSAAVLGAFDVLCKLQTKLKVYALLCLAENAVDQLSMRPDDIITLHSGKTVEVNNTDAEGRLVLGDGVSFATKILKCEYVIDIATLTGAQIMCTGKYIGAVMSNNKQLEDIIVECGKKSGDLVFPILYCPELINLDFKSEVADMKNSAKGKVTAMSSLAGHFIESHLDSEFKGYWAHIDIAGPAFREERGTGFGTGLLITLVEHISNSQN